MYARQTLQPGEMVGEYRVLDLLGRGGMGEVYCAQHTKIGRLAAIKVLTSTPEETAAMERFRNEARIQSSLSHPNIAALYDFIEVDGRPCIVMEYVDGPTLSEMIAARGPLATSDALAIFQAIVSAIAYIHKRGIVHRDIKPNNVKINSAGEVKLLDFGIARAAFVRGLTATGQFVGTVEYLAPEQLQTGRADHRSDVWALGVLLYEIVTGRSPFTAATLGEVCDRIKQAIYEPPSRLNPAVKSELEHIIGRCLKRDPAARYSSAEELAADVERLRCRGEPAVSPPALPKAASNKREATILVGVVGLLFFSLIAIAALLAFVGGSNGGNETRASFAPSQARSVPNAPAPQSSKPKTIIIDVFEGQAQVYRGDQPLGTTPYELTASPGEVVRLNLKRDGFKDKTVEFTVSETRHVYTFRMEK